MCSVQSPRNAPFLVERNKSINSNVVSILRYCSHTVRHFTTTITIAINIHLLVYSTEFQLQVEVKIKASLTKQSN